MEIGSSYNKGLFSIIREHKYSDEIGLFCGQKELKIHSLFHIHIILQISKYQRERGNAKCFQKYIIIPYKMMQELECLPINTIGDWSIMKTHEIPRKTGFSSH